MLGSYFLANDPWVEVREQDMILLEGLIKDDIELVWDFSEFSYVSPEENTDYHNRTGEAAIRVKSTGETLYLGTINYVWEAYYGDYQLYFGSDENLFSFDWSRMAAQREINESLGRFIYIDEYYSDNDLDDWDESVDINIFSFDGVTKLDLFDLFNLWEVTPQPLPAEVKTAEGVLDRIGSGLGGSVVAGTSGADNLVGTSSNEDLLAGDGNDSVNGGGGEDFIRGGAGNDTLSGDAGDDNISGQDGEDILFGGEGNDTLVGGKDSLVGATVYDRMYGGTGNDRYIVEDSADYAYENVGEGTDRVVASINHELRENIEELELAGSSDLRGYGNTLDNLVIGNGGNNLLYGRDGNDSLEGNGGADILYGENGNDSVEGGSGQDRIYGGAGADDFIFKVGDFAGMTSSTADRIHDFSQADGDIISLDGVDANTSLAGDQAFAFIGNAGFSGTAGELRYQQISGQTYVQGDLNGDGAADFWIRLDGLHTLQSGDFVL